MPNVYLTHDNYSNPFRVTLAQTKGVKHALIDRVTYQSEGTAPPTWTRIHDFSYERAFVGKSSQNAMTEFSEGYGLAFDGNSILLHTRGRHYTFIGERIFKFTTDKPITRFVSPVGNNDVPYPYAVDADGIYYLMIAGPTGIRMPMLQGLEQQGDSDDPYKYYYRNRVLSWMRAGELELSRPAAIDLGIRNWRGNDGEEYSFTYGPSDAEYNSLVELGQGAIYLMRVVGGPPVMLTPEMYKAIMVSFETITGISQFADFSLVDPRPH